MCTNNYKTHDGLMKKTCDMKPCVKRRQGRPADLKYFYAAQFDFREEDNTDEVDSDDETAATKQHGKIHRLRAYSKVIHKFYINRDHKYQPELCKFNAEERFQKMMNKKLQISYKTTSFFNKELGKMEKTNHVNSIKFADEEEDGNDEDDDDDDDEEEEEEEEEEEKENDEEEDEMEEEDEDLFTDNDDDEDMDF